MWRSWCGFNARHGFSLTSIGTVQLDVHHFGTVPHSINGYIVVSGHTMDIFKS